MSFYTTSNSTFTFGNTTGFTFRIIPPPPDDGLAGYAAVLGIPPKSLPDVIRRVYREKLMQTHPDHGGSDEAVRVVIDAYRRLIEEAA